MVFKKKGEGGISTVLGKVASAPPVTKVDDTHTMPIGSELIQQSHEAVPPVSEVQADVVNPFKHLEQELPPASALAPAPTESVVKNRVLPCTIPHNVAGDALNLFANNANQEFIGVQLNQNGGLILNYKDRSNGTVRGISLNRDGLIDVIKFGFWAISKNHE